MSKCRDLRIPRDGLPNSKFRAANSETECSKNRGAYGKVGWGLSGTEKKNLAIRFTQVEILCEKTAPKIPNVAPPHFCAHISLSPSPPSSPEKHGESPIAVRQSATHGRDSPGHCSCPHYSLLKRIEPTESSRCGGHDANAPGSSQGDSKRETARKKQHKGRNAQREARRTPTSRRRWARSLSDENP